MFSRSNVISAGTYVTVTIYSLYVEPTEHLIITVELSAPGLTVRTPSLFIDAYDCPRPILHL